MNRHNPFPDLARSFEKMKAQDLMASAPGRGLFAETVRANAYTNSTECMKMIRDQIRDNRVMLIDEVGERLVLLIEKLDI